MKKGTRFQFSSVVFHLLGTELKQGNEFQFLLSVSSKQVTKLLQYMRMPIFFGIFFF